MELVDQKGVSQIRTCLMKQDRRFCCRKIQTFRITCHWMPQQFRSNYLLTQGKSFVTKILFDCVTCKHYDTCPYNYPKPPDLPKERVSCETPFSNSKVDYLGPVYCKNIYDANSSDVEDRHKAFYAVVVFFESPNTGSVENYWLRNRFSYTCGNVLRYLCMPYGLVSGCRSWVDVTCEEEIVLIYPYSKGNLLN